METGVHPSEIGAVAPAVRSLAERLEALRAAVAVVAAREPAPRPEWLSGIHNPWGQAVALCDAWVFLDLCENPDIVTAVEQVIGPDIVLWDCELHLRAASYQRFVGLEREGRYWPMDPLDGAVVLAAPLRTSFQPVCLKLATMTKARLSEFEPEEPLLVIRYFPATSRFIRDPKYPANRVGMEEQPLINYSTRPLWLVRGQDSAANDFISGFSPSVPRWAGTKS